MEGGDSLSDEEDEAEKTVAFLRNLELEEVRSVPQGVLANDLTRVAHKVQGNSAGCRTSASELRRAPSSGGFQLCRHVGCFGSQ